MSNLNVPINDASLVDWMKEHLARTGDVLVFANAGPPTDKPEDKRHLDAEIDISIPPAAILELRGDFDLKDLMANLKSYVKIPLLPAISLVDVVGDLRSGIKGKLDHAFIQGDFNLHLMEDAGHKCVGIDLFVTVFGQRLIKENIKLISLPKHAGEI